MLASSLACGLGAADRGSLGSVDLARVHQELIPEWVVSGGGAEAYERLHREVGPEPRLGEILDRVERLRREDPEAHSAEILALIRDWSRHLEEADQPWRLSGEIRDGALILKSYRAVAEGGVEVGGQRFPVEIRRRADRLALPDAWLGRVHDPSDGVVVLLDGVIDLALDRIWPMLDPELGERLDPVERTFGPAVRAEAARALGPEALAALARTAGDRLEMDRAAEAIRSRHRCGSTFYVSRIPWDGLGAGDLLTLEQAASAPEQPCPEVTEAEWLLFSARTGRLRQVPGLRPALERLAGWAAGAIAIHEARHAADRRALGDRGIPCLGCPEGITHRSALEGSAYLASFADADHGALSLYQACALDPAQVPDRAEMISFLSDRLGGACSAGPPGDLSEAAARLERELFGRSERFGIHDLPARLPVGAD